VAGYSHGVPLRLRTSLTNINFGFWLCQALGWHFMTSIRYDKIINMLENWKALLCHGNWCYKIRFICDFVGKSMQAIETFLPIPLLGWHNLLLWSLLVDDGRLCCPPFEYLRPDLSRNQSSDHLDKSPPWWICIMKSVYLSMFLWAVCVPIHSILAIILCKSLSLSCPLAI